MVPGVVANGVSPDAGMETGTGMEKEYDYMLNEHRMLWHKGDEGYSRLWWKMVEGSNGLHLHGMEPQFDPKKKITLLADPMAPDHNTNRFNSGETQTSRQPVGPSTVEDESGSGAGEDRVPDADGVIFIHSMSVHSPNLIAAVTPHFHINDDRFYLDVSVSIDSTENTHWTGYDKFLQESANVLTASLWRVPWSSATAAHIIDRSFSAAVSNIIENVQVTTTIQHHEPTATPAAASSPTLHQKWANQGPSDHGEPAIQSKELIKSRGPGSTETVPVRITSTAVTSTAVTSTAVTSTAVTCTCWEIQESDPKLHYLSHGASYVAGWVEFDGLRGNRGVSGAVMNHVSSAINVAKGRY
ncbi:hypothetical protein TREMEDRAFT_64460 [Tremella mesenterica DSM 1558]|uniref:uncharacterized protein n=1 Tax=Tremella mesenterica (strain ATCC 24925 / CBS 8224 / DSM 1558 / NBRC 9311 / NRRL Y-6157 / RJB 2259-6 / UBC 559-6) TaxID=578456 RepID=UPI0003F498D2|nr:uncharacterized protein TREMEDRAFT_64460 [Tremella mesenterica DSM 1558]EIW67216.1 hypothetical protein TREMEDRAFT_64460 [Tremella mesenterica DSM 1558]